MHLHFRKTSLNHKIQMQKEKKEISACRKFVLMMEDTDFYNRGQWLLMEWVNPFSKEMMSIPISKFKLTER